MERQTDGANGGKQKSLFVCVGAVSTHLPRQVGLITDPTINFGSIYFLVISIFRDHAVSSYQNNLEIRLFVQKHY